MLLPTMLSLGVAGEGESDGKETERAGNGKRIDTTRPGQAAGISEWSAMLYLNQDHRDEVCSLSTEDASSHRTLNTG